jgi:hypothetical protein
MPMNQLSFEDEHLESAERELERLGYKVAVFSFDYVPENFTGEQAPHPVSDVMVTNTESQKQKTYHRGPGVAWHSAFIADVRAGEFGAPPKGI